MNSQHDDVQLGRLLLLKIKRNAAARRQALDSIREWPRKVTVRIGGRMRGQTVECASRRDAEAQVHRHYRAQLAKVFHLS